jgi:hypothetical protein
LMLDVMILAFMNHDVNDWLVLLVVIIIICALPYSNVSQICVLMRLTS